MVNICILYFLILHLKNCKKAAVEIAQTAQIHFKLHEYNYCAVKYVDFSGFYVYYGNAPAPISEVLLLTLIHLKADAYNYLFVICLFVTGSTRQEILNTLQQY